MASPGCCLHPRDPGDLSLPLSLLQPLETGLVPCVGLLPRASQGRRQPQAGAVPAGRTPASIRERDALSAESLPLGRCPSPCGSREGRWSPAQPPTCTPNTQMCLCQRRFSSARKGPWALSVLQTVESGRRLPERLGGTEPTWLWNASLSGAVSFKEGKASPSPALGLRGLRPGGHSTLRGLAQHCFSGRFLSFWVLCSAFSCHRCVCVCVCVCVHSTPYALWHICEPRHLLSQSQKPNKIARGTRCSEGAAEPSLWEREECGIPMQLLGGLPLVPKGSSPQRRPFSASMCRRAFRTRPEEGAVPRIGAGPHSPQGAARLTSPIVFAFCPLTAVAWEAFQSETNTSLAYKVKKNGDSFNEVVPHARPPRASRFFHTRGLSARFYITAHVGRAL